MPSPKKNKTSRMKSKAKKPKKNTAQRKRAVKAKAPKKAKKKAAQKKVALRTRAGREKKAAVNTEREIRREIRNRVPEAISGRQSGDLQGLSRAEEADSESVEELIEEGNPLEAGVVSGVEEADNADEREVQTHEVAEDDVPEEYFDKE
jgi:hypothetical protein